VFDSENSHQRARQLVPSQTGFSQQPGLEMLLAVELLAAEPSSESKQAESDLWLRLLHAEENFQERRCRQLRCQEAGNLELSRIRL
jgi:hypothetical protein